MCQVPPGYQGGRDEITQLMLTRVLHGLQTVNCRFCDLCNMCSGSTDTRVEICYPRKGSWAMLLALPGSASRWCSRAPHHEAFMKIFFQTVLKSFFAESCLGS